jgi:micrococcal nuclease
VTRLCVLVTLVVLSACSLRPTAAPPAGPPGLATIVRPVDGDTVVVQVGGVEEPEAKHRTAELLPAGTSVQLERDVEARDAYDRLLAYVTRADDGVLVNLLLVTEGYAESARFAPNLAHQAELDRAEADARAGERGLWPVCGGTDVVLGR